MRLPPVIRNQVLCPPCPGPHLGACDAVWSRSPFPFSRLMTSSPSHHWMWNSSCITCRLTRPPGGWLLDHWITTELQACHPCSLVTTSDWRQRYKARGLSVFDLTFLELDDPASSLRRCGCDGLFCFCLMWKCKMHLNSSRPSKASFL